MNYLSNPRCLNNLPFIINENSNPIKPHIPRHNIPLPHDRNNLHVGTAFLDVLCGFEAVQADGFGPL